MKCGKGPEAGGNGGSGVCPVAAESRADGLNGGSNGGRICWVIADGRTCDEIKCSGMHREGSCFTCGFRYRVMQEEGLPVLFCEYYL